LLDGSGLRESGMTNAMQATKTLPKKRKASVPKGEAG